MYIYIYLYIYTYKIIYVDLLNRYFDPRTFPEAMEIVIRVWDPSDSGCAAGSQLIRAWVKEGDDIKRLYIVYRTIGLYRILGI